MEISSYLMALGSSWESLLSSASNNPFVWGVQAALILVASILVYTVFWTTRDILRRSRSVTLQLACVLLVSLLPFVGFFAYILVRPARTLHEKDMADMLAKIFTALQENNASSASLPKSTDTMIARRTFFSTQGIVDEAVKRVKEEKFEKQDLVSLPT